MIAVDWGTSNFRAFRMERGRVRDRVPSGPGILAVPPGGFPAALQAAIGPWLADGERHVLMAGMVGSRQGWIEAPYLACPADLADLARAAIAVPFDGAEIRLVPGLSALDAAGVPEVMRGEEVQLAGILARTGPDALVCLPGSHSKWARIVDVRVETFTTHLTGEAFAAIRGHTILGRLMTGSATDTDKPAFLRGVARAADPGGLLHHLFGVRTLGLFERLGGDAAASFLSGLLIGHEVRAMAPSGTVFLAGSAALCDLYAAAVACCGGTGLVVDEDAAAAGLWRLSEDIRWT